MRGSGPRDTAWADERIRQLEAENALLNERSEDVFLLGLMAENLAPLRHVDAIFRTLLERVGLLYNIDFCAYARACHGPSAILFAYPSTPVGSNEARFRLSSNAIRQLEDGVLICSGAKAATMGVELEIPGAAPGQIVLIPGSCRQEHQGVFVFAYDGPDPEFLPRKLMVLQQVIGLATARVDNILLLEELREVNTDLESRVHDRTRDLHKTALALETEIAERRHAEEILEAERLRLKTVMENLPEGVIVLDSRQRVVMANGAVLHAQPLIGVVAHGMPLLEIAGKPLAAFASNATETSWFEVASEGEPALIYEITVRDLDNGEGSVIVLRDVTEQRIVARNLLRQERMAAMGHLAAGVAHDFNNLIQAVTILAETLLLDAADDPGVRREKTREILSLGERAADLIRRILDYSRQTVSRPELVDFGAFVVETLTMLDRLIPETVAIEIEAEPGTRHIHIDPAQLQQVLTNLVLNASQAMPNGGRIRVRLWSADTPEEAPSEDAGVEEWVCLGISDTGRGIPPEVQPRIYEPFFTTKERGQGTGLGLAQAYGIVTQHSGHISFTTEPGAGTTFTVMFPAVLDDGGGAEVAETPASTPTGHGEVVLVVEDDPTVRELAGELIETLGYVPVCAADGAEALDHIQRSEHDFRLVLSDVSMPGMGGVELAMALRERGSAVPVILMSGYAPDPMGGGFSSPNLAAWLQKPFSVRDLATTVAAVIADHS
ncbi:MAG: ATP-binding protein [Thermoanaerobaculales bacterium]|jgi:signal transduction histidine kinase|nr:ATP-binding protein [Thermoanaerobaculales bacterium]